MKFVFDRLVVGDLLKMRVFVKRLFVSLGVGMFLFAKEVPPSVARDWSADAEFQKQVQLFPHYANTPDFMKCDLLPEMNSVHHHLTIREFSKVVEICTSFLQRYPDCSHAYFYRAQAERYLGRKKQALKDILSALSIDSNIHGFWQFQAELQDDVGMKSEAILSWTNTMRLRHFPERANEVNLFRGKDLVSIKQFLRAKDDLDAYLGYRPNNPEALYLRGICKTNLGQLEAANDDFLLALDYSNRDKKNKLVPRIQKQLHRLRRARAGGKQ